GVSKATFIIGDEYNDEFPLPSMLGDLSGIQGIFNINGWADGNGGIKDRLYVADRLTDNGVLTASSITGFSIPAGNRINYVNVEQVFIQMGDGNDTMRVESLLATVHATIYGGSGDDTLEVGNQADTLNDIDGIIEFYGQTGTDTLNAIDSGNTAPNTGQLTALNITGLGMGSNAWLSVHVALGGLPTTPDGETPCTANNSCPAAIYYASRNDADVISSDVEVVSVFLGSGDDTLQVDSTYNLGVTNAYGGAGDDRFEVGATPNGLHPDDNRRVDYIAGPLNVYGEAGDGDFVIVNDSGDDVVNSGILEGSTVSGLGMGQHGSVTFDSTAEKLEISLGEQNDTFYLRSAPAGTETRLKLNGGYDTVYVGSATNTLDDIQGTLIIEGGLPFAEDALFIMDQGYAGGRIYTITNDPNAFTLINQETGAEIWMDETTISLFGGGQIRYQTFETVVINAGSGNDTLNLEAPHNDRDPLGGKNATFTFNGGAGDDTVYVGQTDAGGKSLEFIDIWSIFNGQAGTDTILFEHTASVVANTLAFVSKTFETLFPANTATWANFYALIFDEDVAITTAALFTTVALGLVSTPLARVMEMGAHTRAFENLLFSFGSGDDVFKLEDGDYYEAITVNGGPGADTFNVADAVTTHQMVTLNGGQGDDLVYVDYTETAPAGTTTITYNGGEHDTEGDTLRFVGDGILGGLYEPSSTQARAGRVTINGNTFDFSGVEPVVVNGFGSFEMVGAENISDYAIESIAVDDMDLTTLVLHVLMVDGVISWRQQVKLEGIDAKETTNYGQALSWDGNTLAIGARRSLTSITDEKPVDQTVVDFIKGGNVAAGQVTLASGTYYVETRDAGSADWEFRLLDWSGAQVIGWQDIPANKVSDTGRGVLIAFGPNEYYYSAVSGGSAASFNYSLGVYPGVVYVYTQSGSTWTEQAKLYPEDGSYAGQGFGDSVALSGDTLVVGAPQDTSLGANAGAAYIFQRSGSSWTQTAKVSASDGAANDRFGSTVAASGLTAVVGAPGDDGDAGSAYVFSGGSGTWVQIAKLTASDRGAGDLFGAALDMTGSAVVVGAPGDDGWRGSAYVYSAGGWNQTQKLVSTSLQAGESFGSAVAIDTFIVVGAPGYDDDLILYDYQGICTHGCNTGAAFVFNWTGSWTLSARLTAAGGLPEELAQWEGRANDHFGGAVTTSGEYVVVGAPDYDEGAMDSGAVYFFRYLPDAYSGAGYSWIRSKDKVVSSTPIENAHFGQTLALSGLQLAVGVPGFNQTDANDNILRENVGIVRFYQTDGVIAYHNQGDGTVGLYRAEIQYDHPNAYRAGYEMLYHSASRTLLVGAPGAGYVYIYANEGLYWRHHQTHGIGWGEFGYDMDIYGDTLAVGAPGANTVYIFNYDGANWVYRTPISESGVADFGRSLDLEWNNAGGNLRLAVGAPNSSFWYHTHGLPYRTDLAAPGLVFTYTGGGSAWNRERIVMPYNAGMPDDTSYLVTINDASMVGGCVQFQFHNGGARTFCGESDPNASDWDRHTEDWRDDQWPAYPGAWSLRISDGIFVVFPRTKIEYFRFSELLWGLSTKTEDSQPKMVIIRNAKGNPFQHSNFAIHSFDKTAGNAVFKEIENFS
nr:FG-GAP repeat protein [Alphaproteobacteria bacterium]